VAAEAPNPNDDRLSRRCESEAVGNAVYISLLKFVAVVVVVSSGRPLN
jgi:hypothetical protein